MSYLAFALKYRPKDFDEVIGQDHVVSSLKNAILSKRIHHAYLFSGPRGIGKTSLARILAKSLNCFEGPTVTPCGKCTSCVEIAKGSSLDIIEIDGASNRGIDEIRTLRENVKLSASVSRYKVYIVDEVHMLTQEAFNALLKTLEEPPEHVKFIFATTHPHKVLPTILSRCQKFQFNLIPLEQIVGKLKKIAKAEKVKIKESLLYTIGRAASGSIRDAESLLDQLVPVILEKGSLEDVFSFLGIIDEESLNETIEFLIHKDLESLLKSIDNIVKGGKDLGIFVNALIEHLRNLLLAKVSPKSFKDLSDVSPQSKDFIIKEAKNITISEVLKLIDLLIESKSLSTRLDSIRIPLELTLVKHCGKIESSPAPQKPKKKSNPKPEPKAEEPSSGADFDDIDFEDEEDDSGKEEEQPPKMEIKEEKEQKLEARDDLLAQPLKVKWNELVLFMQKKRAALASHLSFAKPLFSQGAVVTIGFSAKDAFHKETVEASKNLEAIEGIISEFLNKTVGVRFVVDSSVERSPNFNFHKKENKDSGQAKTDSPAKTSDDDFLNDLLDTFDGKFHTGNE